MGTLYYGTVNDPIVIPDRLLAHLKVVMTTKLRRSERFTLSWKHAADTRGGRSTIWIDPSIPLRFLFDSAEGEELDPELLRELANSASSTGGLMVDLSDARANLTAVEQVA
jgi:hypothetical protein